MTFTRKKGEWTLSVQDLKKNYDLIVSLGISCAPAIQLRRHNLRRISLPLDWMISTRLSDVNRLLQHRYQGFMEMNNLQVLEDTHIMLEDGNPVFHDRGGLVESYMIKDTLYNIISVHDFPLVPGQHWSVLYPEYKEKLQRRIQRFYDKLAGSSSTLFIRWSASYEETFHLRAILSQLTLSEFRILVLNPVEGQYGITDAGWNLDRVCSLNVPPDMNALATWDELLAGMTISEG
ncbi:DUF1796 family putative cysteine peptidase [Paenibacillus sp. TCA20]|uniref:DUF1796 family putative cysteine peptidase n=1 Tax=Paenibacillus sp. TCA20 TaxID=1499968 RepID=UPI001EE638E3|nr:DUF1796 family putative cysteine peptidase [Paenibacillus sp. TCA20]